jgi:hypothetical protein
MGNVTRPGPRKQVVKRHFLETFDGREKEAGLLSIQKNRVLALVPTGSVLSEERNIQHPKLI